MPKTVLFDAFFKEKCFFLQILLGIVGDIAKKNVTLQAECCKVWRTATDN